MLKELKSIYVYYKNKYQLESKVNLCFKNSFNPKTNTINFDKNLLIFCSNGDNFWLEVFLHEIKHSIDWKQKRLPIITANLSPKVINKFEKQAGIFAKKELKKWIN